MQTALRPQTEDYPARSSKIAVRNGLVGWIERAGCNWCLTLNPNRALGLKSELDLVRSAFADADAALLGPRYNRVDARKRILGFVMPEHVRANLHFHLAVRPGLHADVSVEQGRMEVLAESWKSKVPSGSFEIAPVTNIHGWARYITKEMGREDAEFMPSSIWWPARQRRHVLERSWLDPMTTSDGV